MSDRPESGSVFGVPYNFERPSVRRLLSAYWEPDEGMLVEKPFGIGYTLNLASWRSWVVLGVAALLYYNESDRSAAAGETADQEAVEVVVDED